jgi:hypothetical protein
VARQSAWAPRFRKVMGEHGQWELEQFSAADLGGRVDVMSDSSTAWPKSPLMTNLKLKEAVGMGVIVPQMDPELSRKILTMMDLSDLKPTFEEARSQVARHLGLWKAATTPQDLQLPYLQPQPHWDLELHKLLKSTFLNSELAEALSSANPPVYQAMVQHVQQLDMLLQQQMMAKMAAQAPPPKPGKPEQKGPDGSALQGAIESGALKPAGAVPEEPKPDPLGQAVASGALMPAGMVPPPPPAGPSIDELLAAGVLSPSLGPPEKGTGR